MVHWSWIIIALVAGIGVNFSEPSEVTIARDASGRCIAVYNNLEAAKKASDGAVTYWRLNPE